MLRRITSCGRRLGRWPRPRDRTSWKSFRTPIGLSVGATVLQLNLGSRERHSFQECRSLTLCEELTRPQWCRSKVCGRSHLVHERRPRHEEADTWYPPHHGDRRRSPVEYRLLHRRIRPSAGDVTPCWLTGGQAAIQHRRTEYNTIVCRLCAGRAKSSSPAECRLNFVAAHALAHETRCGQPMLATRGFPR